MARSYGPRTTGIPPASGTSHISSQQLTVTWNVDILPSPVITCHSSPLFRFCPALYFVQKKFPCCVLAFKHSRYQASGTINNITDDFFFNLLIDVIKSVIKSSHPQ